MAIVATERDPAELTGASPACAVPDGTAHALDPDQQRTRCGLSASALVPWPEFTWPPAGMAGVDACPACSCPPVGSEHG
jgi:hypothetical protein